MQGNELIVHPIRKFINFKEDKTKLNLGKMYRKALKLADIVSALRKKVQILEGKYDFLEYCNKEFGENNKNIVAKLQKILEKKHNLENCFGILVNIVFPSLQLVDNSLPLQSSSEQNKSQPNNQISEVKNNEMISQLYKMFNLNDNNNNISINNQNGIIPNNNLIQNNKKNNNIINGINIVNNSDEKNFICNKNQLNQLMEGIVDTEQSSTEEREIKTYNKIIDFQKSYFKDLEEQNSNNNLNLINLDSQVIQENNSIKSYNSFKNDKDLLNVTSNNSSLNLDNKKFLNKKTFRDSDGLSDGSKDLL